MAIGLYKREEFRRSVGNRETYAFEIVGDGVFLIAVAARCKNWIQNLGRLFNDDDLAVEIDDVPWHEFRGKRKEFSTPASWNGNELKNVRKTVYFIVPLTSGLHHLAFVSDGAPFVETLEIHRIEPDGQRIILGEDFLPKEDRGKFFFDIAWKNIEVTGVSATPRVVGRNAPQLKVDGRLIKEWSDIQVVSQDDIHFLEIRGKNGAGVNAMHFRLTNVRFNRRAKVALYKDIVSGDTVYLRSMPADDKDETVIGTLRDGDALEILEERVPGKQVAYWSNIWHKVRHQDKEGYALSSFVEIEGQERQRIIELIREKAKDMNMNPDWALALAGCESHYKVYAVSEKGAKGIFQLTEDLIADLNNPSSRFYSPVADPFTVSEGIRGGLSFFQWLYEERYKRNSDRLLRSVVAYNAGPGKVAVDGRFHLKDYTDEPQKLAACFLENRKRRNWMNVIKPLMILLVSAAFLQVFMPFGPSPGEETAAVTRSKYSQIAATQSLTSILPDEKGDGAGLRFSELKDEQYPSDLEKNQEQPVPFALDTESHALVFFYKDGAVAGRLPVHRLGLEKTFRVEEEWKRDAPILERAVEALPGVFYFLLTSHGYCGSGGCTFALYRYDTRHDTMTFLDTHFGGSAYFFLSPGTRTLAIARDAGGHCFANGYLHLLDLSTDKMTEVPIHDFTPRHISSSAIHRFAWKDDSVMEIETIESICPYPSIARTFSYDFRTGRSQLLSERQLPGS